MDYKHDENQEKNGSLDFIRQNEPSIGSFFEDYPQSLQVQDHGKEQMAKASRLPIVRWLGLL